METEKINILIAEDNSVSRSMLAGIVKAKGYTVLEARDGEEAVRLSRDNNIHAAIIDQMMEPAGGFHFARYVTAGSKGIPIIMVTAHDISDVLLETGKYGIACVLQKPVSPEKLLSAIARVLMQKGTQVKSIVTETIETKFSHEDLMRKAIEIAAENIKSGKGGPFGAIVADRDGKILGEGASGMASRCDPIAHAEVMAIRKATEKMGRPELEGCVLYCSGEPTKVGKALIASVGIDKVYYALNHSEIGRFIGGSNRETEIEYVRLCHEDAAAMLTVMGERK